MSEVIKAVLAGNPNSGKTTIFNNLTRSRHHVANYPGVTVSTQEGVFSYGGKEITLVDLPGTYSLTAYSAEELIARDFIIQEKPDVVIDILDATNLERNLYLATQLMELGVPVILVLNMSDMARYHGENIDIEKLSKLLRVPIIPTVGHKKEGMEELCQAILDVLEGRAPATGISLHYGHDIDPAIRAVAEMLDADDSCSPEVSSSWTALKLLENDSRVKKKMAGHPVLELADQRRTYLEHILGDLPETVIAGHRYGFISGACQESLLPSSVEARHIQSDKIDALLTHRVWGLPIFLGLMYLVFSLTFSVGGYPMAWLESLFGWLSSVISSFWPAGSESILKSLLVDGIIGGVGGVVSFLPNILLLFLAIAFLEDSGYMSRAAFIMDHLMHKIGLHGQSFIPMLIGFGCSIPAILATRTLNTRRDRFTTIMIIPLMSCGARLTVYALIIPAFFPLKWQAPVLLSIYLIGILLAVGVAWLLRHTLLRGESIPFVMELPPYRMPTFRGVFIHTWSRSWEYLKKAGTVILAISIVLWAMTSFPKKKTENAAFTAEAVAVQLQYVQKVDTLAQEMNLPEDLNFQRLLESADEVASEGHPQLMGFLAMRERVQEVELNYSQTVNEYTISKESPVWIRAKLERELMLTQLRNSDTETFRLVEGYERNVLAPYRGALRRMEQQKQSEALSYSMLGRMGRFLEPVWKPMGFDWRIGTAMIGAFAAKEVFVAQMGIVFAVGDAETGANALRHKLQAAYSPLVGFCILLFSLISAPCLATIAVTKKETGSWMWAMFQLTGLTLFAYIITVAVYQAGLILGLGI